MAQSIQDRYMENEVLGADAGKLVVILYRAAIESLAGARVNVRNQEIRERSQKITRASGIIHELLRSLNHAEGGSISRNLAELYAYMQMRLAEANASQKEAPLAEVESLLRTLLDAWTQTAGSAAVTAPARENPISAAS